MRFAFLSLAFVLLALLQLVRLLLVPATHLVRLLPLTVLELVLALLIGRFSVQSLAFLIVPLLKLLPFGVLLPLQLFAFTLVFLVQPGIIGSVAR